MLQDGGLPPSMRPIPLLRHVASLYRNPIDLDALIKRLDIESFASRTIRRLSGGQKQRVALAAALAGDPEVVFLDEPSAGLDPQSRQVVFDLIGDLRDAGKAIILTTHLMDDAQKLSDYVYIIDRGRTVAQGTVSELTTLAAAEQQTRPVSFGAGAGLALPDTVPAGLHLSETAPGEYRLDGVRSPEHLLWLTTWWAEAGILPHHLSLQAAAWRTCSWRSPRRSPITHERTDRASPAPERAQQCGLPVAAHRPAGKYETLVMLSNGEQLVLAIVMPLIALFALTFTNLIDGVAERNIDAAVPGVLALCVVSTAFTGQGIGTGFDRRYGVLRMFSTTRWGAPG